MKRIRTRQQSAARTTIAAIVVLAVGAAIGWSVSVVLEKPAEVLTATPYTYVQVVSGEVGSSMTLNTAVEWAPVPTGVNRATGTVTTVDVAPGDQVAVGSVLYTVDLRPVVIAQGGVPAFRAMQQNIAGTDVLQLQNALAGLNLYSGPLDGKFGARTTAAVKVWQKALGVNADGVVQVGDIIFVPSLPARVALDEKLVSRGIQLSGGEATVSALPAAPVFTVPVTGSQAASMPTGTRVEISGPSSVWEGYVIEQTVDENAEIALRLEGRDGGTVCGDDCAQVPVGSRSLFPSKVVTVETKTGLVVPSAALLSGADGNISVIDDEGTSHPVTVATSARGMSVIEGVDEGVMVRVPAQTD